MAKTNAQAVSAFLRRAGYLPVPRSRAGVHVTRSYQGAAVSVSFDGPEQEDAAVANSIALLLQEGGYDANWDADYPTAVHVTGRRS